MTSNEKAVMTDCYRYLDQFNQPLPKDDPECANWWKKAAEAYIELGKKHNNHPLVLNVGTGVFSYIEEKWKAINRKRGIK